MNRDFRCNAPLLADVWVDKRSIRRKFDGTRDDIPWPPLFPDYQHYMTGVDRGDQLIGYYNREKIKEVVEEGLFHILECSIHNG